MRTSGAGEMQSGRKACFGAIRRVQESDFDVREVGNLEINIIRLLILLLEDLRLLVLEFESL